MDRKVIEDMFPDDELMFADGFDDCILGVSEGINSRIIYNAEAIIRSLAKDMDEDEASEYFMFNISGAYMGPLTPIYVWTEL